MSTPGKLLHLHIYTHTHVHLDTEIHVQWLAHLWDLAAVCLHGILSANGTRYYIIQGLKIIFAGKVEVTIASLTHLSLSVTSALPASKTPSLSLYKTHITQNAPATLPQCSQSSCVFQSRQHLTYDKLCGDIVANNCEWQLCFRYQYNTVLYHSARPVFWKILLLYSIVVQANCLCVIHIHISIIM